REVLPRDLVRTVDPRGQRREEAAQDLLGRGVLARERALRDHLAGLARAPVALLDLSRRGDRRACDAQRRREHERRPPARGPHRASRLSRSGIAAGSALLEAGASSACATTPRRGIGLSGTSGSGEEVSWMPARRGRVSRKFAPSPGLAHTSSQPPCRCASSSEIASPSPVPPVVRARALSARQKRSKTCSTASWLMPTP